MARTTVNYTNPASGSKVRFDDDGAGNLTQDVKLVDSTAGDLTPIGVAANPIHVQGAQTGATNETAASSDTATSGLNGRLQRIAQRITSLIALFPTTLSLFGGLRVAQIGYANATWTSVHMPAVNVKATTTQAAAGAGVQNVCTGFSITFAAGSTAPAAVNVSVALRDGATGAGTILWQGTFSLPAVAGSMAGTVRQNLWIPGTAATAMTLEFSAAGGANTFECVSMEGTTVG